MNKNRSRTKTTPTPPGPRTTITSVKPNRPLPVADITEHLGVSVRAAWALRSADEIPAPVTPIDLAALLIARRLRFEGSPSVLGGTHSPRIRYTFGGLGRTRGSS